MELTTVKIEDLKFNEVQPDYRTERKNLHGLIGSIRQYGIMQPILVNKKTMEIIDGHRRVAVCRILELDKIPAIIYNGELQDKAISSIDAFAICNSDTKALKKIDFVSIYKKGGSVPAGIANDLIKITEKLGAGFIEKMIARKQAPNSVTRYFSLGEALGYSSKKEMKNFIEWIHNHKAWFLMRTFEKEAKATPNCTIASKIKKCVENNTPLMFEVKA